MKRSTLFYILICAQYLSSLTAFVATKRNRGARLNSGRKIHVGWAGRASWLRFNRSREPRISSGSPETNLRSSRTVVGCLVVASKLRPTVPVPHCSGPVDSTMSVTNSVDATRPRASTGNVVYAPSPRHSSKRSSFGPYLPSIIVFFSWTI